MTRTRFRFRLVFLFGSLAAQGLGAQAAQRPKLPKDADPNDWGAYFDLGVAKLQRQPNAASDAFYWASRLNPSRAEPLFARYVSFWAKDIEKFGRFLQDDEEVLRDPKVLQAVDLRSTALARNPFVHQGLVMALYDALPGRFRESVITTAWIYYGRADLPHALERFAVAIDRDPKKYGYARFVRASAFVNLQQYDSASAEIETLLKQLRAEDEKTVGSEYQSKEMLEYASGLLLYQRNKLAAAREAFGRSVVENASFVAAHAMLGEMAMSSRDTATALLEYGTTIQIDSSDVMMRIGYGRALVAARRPADAAVQFRKAVELEPYYAESYYLLALALEASGAKPAAADAYRQFLNATTLGDFRREKAQGKIAELGR
jgi:tetratricopeptide (TPR) repeat protein